MSMKERLRRQLISARQLSERLLEDFKAPEEWTRQVHEGANHALWFAGHMAHSDNFWISQLDPTRAIHRPDYMEKFGMGSQPTSQASDYPPVEEVLAAMRERRETLLGILDRMNDEDLSRPTPEGSPEFLPDIGSVFEMAIWHEGLHSGQLSVTRRAQGHPPIF